MKTRKSVIFFLSFFVSLFVSAEHTERELETALVEHVTQFLLELGAGFTYIGRQVPLQVGERDFFWSSFT